MERFAHPFRLLPACLLVFLLLFDLASSQSCRLAPDIPPPVPLVLTLSNGKASHSLTFRLCAAPNSDLNSIDLNSPILTSSNPTLRPTVIIDPNSVSIATSPCTNFDAQFIFRSDLGTADLTLAVSPDCTFTFPVVIAGVAAVALPSRARITAPDSAPLVLAPPRYEPSKAFLSVTVVLPSGERVTGVDAANLVTVDVTEDLPDVVVRLASEGRPTARGNLLIQANTDQSDVPRPAFPFDLVLRATSTNASTSVPVRVAALGPTVEAIELPSRAIPNDRTSQITFTVSRTGGDERRLVLLLQLPSKSHQRVIAKEVEYKRDGDAYLSTIELPALGTSVVGEVQWLYEVIQDGRVLTANDRTDGVLLKYGRKPVLNSLFPQRLATGSRGFMMLLGVFSHPAKQIVFNGEPIPKRDVVKDSDGEIVLRIPPTYTKRNGTKVFVAVQDGSGLRSDALSFVVDSSALMTNAVLLQSAYDDRNGRFLVPFFCEKSNDPTVLATVDAYGVKAQDPEYTFSMRTSSMPSDARAYILYSGNNDIVTFADDNPFEDSDAMNDQIVTVFVEVGLGDRRGEALLLISQRLRKDKVGMTVLPLPITDFDPNSEQILESRLSLPADCPRLNELDVTTQWRLNGNPVPMPSQNASLAPPAKGPSVLGLGNRLLLPGIEMVQFNFSVSFTSRGNGKEIASGSWQGDVRRTQNRNRLQVILNDRLVTMTVPAGKEFNIKGTVFDGFANISNKNGLRYTWNCVEKAADQDPCPEVLFSPALDQDDVDTGSFTVSAPGEWQGKTVEYSLYASYGNRRSNATRLNVSFVDSDTNSIPSATLGTAARTSDSANFDQGFAFRPYDAIILSLDGEISAIDLDFALYDENSDVDLLRGENGAELIAHNGYWSPEERRATFLGVAAGSLRPGTYRLDMAHEGEDVSSSRATSSWEFTIAPSEHLILSDPPVRDGVVDQTLFHASAMSVPTSENQFFFSLKSVEGGGERMSVSSITDHCLGGCTGLPGESFTVGKAGKFVLVVDMYDPTGTVLLGSKDEDVEIHVRDSMTTSTLSSPADADDVAGSMARSLTQMDEVAFLGFTVQLTALPSVSPGDFETAVDGLKKISSSRMRNPFQAVRVIDTCAGIVQHEDFSRLDLLRSLVLVVQSCVRRTQQSLSSGKEIKDSLARFYGAAADTIAASSGSDSRNLQTSEGDGDPMGDVRTAASQDLFLVLAMGAECGAAARVAVPRLSAASSTQKESDSNNSLFDDYRVGINCFGGQVRSLSPDPPLLEICRGELGRNTGDNAGVEIFTAAERHETCDRDLPTETLQGPTLYVETLQWGGDGTQDLGLVKSNPKGECFRSTVSVFGMKGNEEDSRFKDGNRITCRNAGKIFVHEAKAGSEAGFENATTTDVSDFQLHPTGRISASAEHSHPAAIRMEVNGTLLRACLDLSTLEGSRGSGLAVMLASVLGGIVAFFVVLAVIALYLTSCSDRFETFTVPTSAAQMSSPTTDSTFYVSRGDSSTLHSRDGSGVPNEWEAEYASLSAIADRTIDSDPEREQNGTEQNSSTSRKRETQESDGFFSRGTFQGFERPSLTDTHGIIPWMSNSSSSYAYRSRQIDFLGSTSSSEDDYVVPDTYGRSGEHFP